VFSDGKKRSFRHKGTKTLSYFFKFFFVSWWQSIFNNVSFEIELIVYKGKNNKSIWQKNPPFRLNQKGGFFISIYPLPCVKERGYWL
jgi:hypothetical protein